MMYAYSVSTNRSLVVAVVALAVVISGQRAQAQPGWVLSHQKISDTEGGFTGILLDDVDTFGASVASLGDLDGDGMGDLAVGVTVDDDGGHGCAASSMAEVCDVLPSGEFLGTSIAAIGVTIVVIGTIAEATWQPHP